MNIRSAEYIRNRSLTTCINRPVNVCPDQPPHTWVAAMSGCSAFVPGVRLYRMDTSEGEAVEPTDPDSTVCSLGLDTWLDASLQGASDACVQSDTGFVVIPDLLLLSTWSVDATEDDVTLTSVSFDFGASFTSSFIGGVGVADVSVTSAGGAVKTTVVVFLSPVCKKPNN